MRDGVNILVYQYANVRICESANVRMCLQVKEQKRIYKLAVPGFEPGSSGPQPLMLTTTLYHPTNEDRVNT